MKRMVSLLLALFMAAAFSGAALAADVQAVYTSGFFGRLKEKANAQEEAAPFEPVPIDQLANKASLRKKCTDEEFQAAYDAALEIVRPLAGRSRVEQLQGIKKALRDMYDREMTYSSDSPHYNDPYGYFILKTASCAGCARATGLCLNILGIEYEHVNENQWTHQWCRVNVDGTYWICDAYGLYCGPEPAPYHHPIEGRL